MKTLILDIKFNEKYFERVIHHEVFHIINDSFNTTLADTIYNLIKIPNLEIYETKTENKLRYLYTKQPFTIGLDNNINCYDSKKILLDKKYQIIKKNLDKYDQEFLKKINLNILFYVRIYLYQILTLQEFQIM